MIKMPKAYREVFEILKYIPANEKEKISSELLKTIEENMDLEYEFKIEDVANFQKQELLPETKAFLAVLYRDCWATAEEKSNILEKEKVQMEEYKLKQEANYDIANVINKAKLNKASTEVIVTNKPVVRQQNVFLRLVEKIKELFRK